MNHLIFHDQELSMMTSMLPSSRHFVQAAWVVPDLEVAIMHWVRTAGVGPFFTIQRPKGDGAVYRGSPAQTPNCVAALAQEGDLQIRSEEHTSELQSLMRISYAVFCSNKKKHQ